MNQLLIAFIVIAVLLAAAAAVGYVGVERQDAANRELTSEAYVLKDAVSALRGDFTTSQLAVSGFVLTGEGGFLGSFRHARADFAVQLARLGRHASPGLRGLVATQARTGAAWFVLAGRATAHPLPLGFPEAARLAARSSVITTDFLAANTRARERVAAQISRLTAAAHHSLRVGLAWSVAALAVAVAFGLVAAVSTVRSVTGPLRGLSTAVRRLAAGDHAARAGATGSAEVRNVARSVNALADEGDRLRQQEAESIRLREMARAAGLRIREHLDPAAVINEARVAIEENLDADAAYLHLLDDDGRPGLPVGHEHDWVMPATFLTDIGPAAFDLPRELLRTQSSMVIQDTRGEEGDRLPPEMREPLRRAGVVSHLLTPFGIGSEPLGVIVAERLHPGHPWTMAEIDAFESIAADIGRGLHHARQYETETRLVEDLKSVDRAKSGFFATVSHELRAPLTSIEGYIEIIRDQSAGPVTPEQERMLETVDRNTARLRNLIEDMFTLSKLESGAFTTIMRPVNLGGVIASAIDAVQPEVAAKGLTLTSEYPGGGLTVNGDAGQLDQVLMNLLSNAVKFTPAGGHIQVTATAEAATAVVTVRDTGIGIPEADQKELFTQFFRASNATGRSIPGTGLGLTIVNAIVTHHSGGIDLQSREGTGTTVTVRLPLLTDRPPAAGPG